MSEQNEARVQEGMNPAPVQDALATLGLLEKGHNPAPISQALAALQQTTPEKASPPSPPPAEPKRE